MTELLGADDELRREQDYVDRAWTAREKTRATLGQAGSASAGGAHTHAVHRHAQRAADNLGHPGDPVLFSRVDDLEGGTLYLGKHAIHDDSYDLLVINWQADAAAPYYRATYADPAGLRRKRTFDLHGNHVLGFDDVVFAELAARVDELTGDESRGITDAVLRELDADRSGAMRDIVATIHAAQYELVRAPLDRLLLVQGGPGTGKTVVALHRVSWLLYNHRESLRSTDVLVVGPNPTFTKYIQKVLPELGDTEVVHSDLRSLGPLPSGGRAEESAVQRLKGDARMAGLLARAMGSRVRFPERGDEIEIPVVGGPPVTLLRAGVEAELASRLRTARTYTGGRAGMRTWLSDTMARRMEWGAQVAPGAVENVLERMWPSLTPASFLRDLFSSRDRLLTAAGNEFTAAEVQLLVRTSAERLSEETWSDADVALLDKAEQLLNGSGRTFSHLVLDEAQDLSPMQLRAARRRCPSGSMTVVGDLAQSTGLWSRESWDDVVDGLRGECAVQREELLLGYRVPQQVFDYAAQLLPHIAPGLTAPSVVRSGPADPDLEKVDDDEVVAAAVRAAQSYAARGLFVGIICPSSHREDLVHELGRAGVSFKDAGAGSLGTSINLVAPQDAKGLEFDAVVVLEPEDFLLEGEHGLRLLYVALTRTTRYLSVVHSRSPLPLPVPHEPPAVPDLDLLDELWLPAQPPLLPSLDPQLELGAVPSEIPPSGRRELAVASVPVLPPPPPPVALPPLPPPRLEEAPPAEPADAADYDIEPAHALPHLPQLGDALTRAVAAEVAEQLRRLLVPETYEDVLVELRRRLIAPDEER